MEFSRDLEWPTIIHSPYGLWIFYGFLWNGYGFRILQSMDFGMDMDLVSNPSGPTAPELMVNKL